MRSVIGTHIEEMHAALAVPPQTNEVGRSAALLAGLFDLVAASGVHRTRLLELGASAGLNLLLDSAHSSPLAEVSLEFDLDDPRGAKPELRTRLWTPDWGRSVRERLIGTAHDHGVPVTLTSSPA